jgi:hypothetical protein
MNLNFQKNNTWDLNEQSWVKNISEMVDKEIKVVLLSPLIRRIFLFRLDINFTVKVLQKFQLIKFKAGEVIYRQGDPVDEIYFLLEGEIGSINHYSFTRI